ncbi:MAG: flagellar assembly protein FliW [Acidimicrobiales bacterium]
MQITTTRFGVLDALDEQMVEIQGGLLGFPDASRYLRVEMPDAEGWLWLQSVDDPELAFLAIDAFLFFPAYDLELPESDVAAIELEAPTDAEVLALVTVHRADDGTMGGITANLLGPLVINDRTKVGRQVVLSDSQYSTREIVSG